MRVTVDVRMLGARVTVDVRMLGARVTVEVRVIGARVTVEVRVIGARVTVEVRPGVTLARRLGGRDAGVTRVVVGRRATLRYTGTGRRAG